MCPTGLLRVEERLLEAEYFLKRMARERGKSFGYNPNAFLSSAQSVTFERPDSRFRLVRSGSAVVCRIPRRISETSASGAPEFPT